MQVIWRLLLYLIVSFVWFYIFSSIFYGDLWRLQLSWLSPFPSTSPGVAASWLSFGSHHWSFRLCCPRSGRNFLGSASRRIKDPLTLAGWILFWFEIWRRTPLHIVFLDSLPHLQKQQADDSWAVRVSGAQKCQMEYCLIFEGFPDLHVIFMSAFSGNMCVY